MDYVDSVIEPMILREFGSSAQLLRYVSDVVLEELSAGRVIEVVFMLLN